MEANAIKCGRDYWTKPCPGIGVPSERVRVTRTARDIGPGWFIVRLYDGGGRLAVHADSLQATR